MLVRLIQSRIDAGVIGVTTLTTLIAGEAVTSFSG